MCGRVADSTRSMMIMDLSAQAAGVARHLTRANQAATQAPANKRGPHLYSDFGQALLQRLTQHTAGRPVTHEPRTVTFERLREG